MIVHNKKLELKEMAAAKPSGALELRETSGAVLTPAAEAGEPEADAAVKARAGWVRRFFAQGKSATEAEHLADLTFSPNTRKRFFSGAAPKTAGPDRKPFFGGRTAELAEPEGKV